MLEIVGVAVSAKGSEPARVATGIDALICDMNRQNVQLVYLDADLDSHSLTSVGTVARRFRLSVNRLTSTLSFSTDQFVWQA